MTTADQIDRQRSEAKVWERVEKFRPYLRAVAAEMLGNDLAAKVDPSDVVQSALLTAHDRLPQYRGQTADAWQHWLVAIVRNEARQARRYWRQQRRQTERDQTWDHSRDELRQLADEQTSPSQHAQRRENAARLMAALQRLPPDDRQVILLRHFEGLPHAEIAHRLGRSEASVRQLWLNALTRLRDTLK